MSQESLCRHDTCILCETDEPCDTWHLQTQHNMPLGWAYDEHDEWAHLRVHIGYLADQFQEALSNNNVPKSAGDTDAKS